MNLTTEPISQEEFLSIVSADNRDMYNIDPGYNKTTQKDNYKDLNRIELRVYAEMVAAEVVQCSANSEERKEAEKRLQDVLHELCSRPADSDPIENNLNENNILTQH